MNITYSYHLTLGHGHQLSRHVLDQLHVMSNPHLREHGHPDWPTRRGPHEYRVHAP